MKKRMTLCVVLTALLLSTAIGATTPTALTALERLRRTVAALPLGCRLETISGVGYACLTGPTIGGGSGSCPGWLAPEESRPYAFQMTWPGIAQADEVQPIGTNQLGTRPKVVSPGSTRPLGGGLSPYQ